MQYSLVYDAATTSFHFPLQALFGLIPIALGLTIGRFPGLWFENRERLSRFFGLLVSSFGVLVLLGVPIAEWIGLRRLRDGLATQSYTVAEGVVSQFVAGQPDGHPMERFSVGRQDFRYSSFTSPGFNKISTQGGPIHDGLQVRIASVDGNIARLEIAR